MNNHTTIPITTTISNILVTLTSHSTITTTAISSASGKVSINPAPAISVAATAQDANFETRLNAMENAIYKLESTLEKFISILGVSLEEKMIEDICLISESILPNLKLIRPLTMRVTVPRLLERNPSEML